MKKAVSEAAAFNATSVISSSKGIHIIEFKLWDLVPKVRVSFTDKGDLIDKEKAILHT